MNYSLATADDFEFVRRVHHICIREHVEKIWGWEEAAQDEFVREDFESGEIQVVVVDGANAGYLQVTDGPEFRHVVNILLLPQFQRRGLGSQIMRDQMRAARDAGKTLRLGVFKVNSRARELYERLGFVTYGDSETHFLMENK